MGILIFICGLFIGSWIDSKEIDWIEQDLAQVREEKINQILK